MYNIEIRVASKNGWFTPDEARAYYGRYSRQGITWHWWGDGTGASNHDNIVNYMLRGAEAGEKSVNYVLSDNKITMVVNPDMVAWTSQGGNATTISVELQPTLGAEGYKKAGWLAQQLKERYGYELQYYPHNYWFATQCPGSISLDRIRQEQNKWATGQYNPAPAPAPTPAPTPTPTPAPSATLTWSAITPQKFKFNKPTTNLYNVSGTSWNMPIVNSYKQGDPVDIAGVIHNSYLKRDFYCTKYSLDNKKPNGFSKADLDVFVEPAPAPAPAPVPQVIVVPVTPTTMYTLTNAKLVKIKDLAVVKQYALDTPMEIVGKARFNNMDFYLTKYAVENNTAQGFLVGDLKLEKTPAPAPQPELPEYVKNLRDIDDTTFWFKEDTALIDITTSKPTGTKTFKKDEPFTSSALTVANGVEYRITEYSFSKKIFNGVPINSLTLTKPGEPDIAPVPVDPDLKPVPTPTPTPVEDDDLDGDTIEFLEQLRDEIDDFIDGKKKQSTRVQ